MAKAKKRAAARKKTSKRPKASAKPARKIPAKRKAPKKAKSRGRRASKIKTKPASEEKRPLEPETVPMAAQMSVENTIEAPTPDGAVVEEHVSVPTASSALPEVDLGDRPEQKVA